MKFQRNHIAGPIDRFCLQAALGGLLVYACSVFCAVAAAAPALPNNVPSGQIAPGDAAPRPQFRRPPQQAVDACEGKKEGDSCTFTSPRGALSGLCLSGTENIFGCRPHRVPQQADAATVRTPQTPSENVPQANEQKVVPPATPQPESAATGKAGGEARRLPEAPQIHQPSASARKAEKESSVQPPQTVPSPPQELPPPLSHPSLPGDFIDQLRQNAGGFGSCLAAALIASALTWYAFYRYSTLPLRRLRTVTQQLAGGDLSARVGEGLVHRKGEVVDLGRDVDRMAERIESLVGAHQRLIRDVSHELRSPLARLNVALELARQSAGLAHAAPFDRIERESDRLNELIGQLLMLTKLETESGTILRTEIDMAALVAEIAQDVDFEAHSNNRSVVATTSEPLLMNGNRELLRQALENLIRNAARYTPPETAVEISLRRKDSGGRGWAHIEVRDYGPGVPESELYDIFRPFYRVNDARERQSGGSGVGLAISDRAVRLHGGSLRAFNAPGVGLIMEMELPLA